jgi:hypothetical protein
MKEEPQGTNAFTRVNEKFYDLLFDSTDQGFALLEKVTGRDGQPIDYVYLKVNSAFERHSGVNNAVGKTVRELIPRIGDELMVLIDGVNDTGQKLRFVGHKRGAYAPFPLFFTDNVIMARMRTLLKMIDRFSCLPWIASLMYTADGQFMV